MQAADDGEVFACIHAVDDTAGNYVIRRVEHRHTHVLHLGGDGKTEKDYLHDGMPSRISIVRRSRKIWKNSFRMKDMNCFIVYIYI